MPATTGRTSSCADPAAARNRARPDQRPQRPVASAGRHVRRRHRRSSARLGRVADRRARLRPHQPGVEVRLATTADQLIARAIGKTSRDAVARAGRRFPDAGLLRFGRLLLRQHRLVAERDDAESRRSRIRGSCSSGCSATAAAREARRRAAQPDGSILDSVRDEVEPPGDQTSGAGDKAQAGRIPRLGARDRAAHPARRRRSRLDIELPERPTDIPDAFDEHTKLMFDLQALAFQADITRVFSMIMSRELSTRTFANIGVPEQHHAVSHHRNDPELIAKKAKIDMYQAQLLRLLPREAAGDAGRRRLAARSLADALRRRHGRRQPAPPRRSAVSAGGQPRRHVQDRAPSRTTRATRRWPTCC